LEKRSAVYATRLRCKCSEVFSGCPGYGRRRLEDRYGVAALCPGRSRCAGCHWRDSSSHGELESHHRPRVRYSRVKRSVRRSRKLVGEPGRGQPGSPATVARAWRRSCAPGRPRKFPTLSHAIDEHQPWQRWWRVLDEKVVVVGCRREGWWCAARGIVVWWCRRYPGQRDVTIPVAIRRSDRGRHSVSTSLRPAQSDPRTALVIAEVNPPGFEIRSGSRATSSWRPSRSNPGSHWASSPPPSVRGAPQLSPRPDSPPRIVTRNAAKPSRPLSTAGTRQGLHEGGEKLLRTCSQGESLWPMKREPACSRGRTDSLSMAFSCAWYIYRLRAGGPDGEKRRWQRRSDSPDNRTNATRTSLPFALGSPVGCYPLGDNAARPHGSKQGKRTGCL